MEPKVDETRLTPGGLHGGMAALLCLLETPRPGGRFSLKPGK